MSRNFGYVDLDHLTFPATMKVDYIRVYQDPNAKNVGCDPEDFPTQAYINECVLLFGVQLRRSHFVSFRYIEAYTNPNLTTWRDDFGQTFPKSSFLGQC